MMTIYSIKTSQKASRHSNFPTERLSHGFQQRGASISELTKPVADSKATYLTKHVPWSTAKLKLSISFFQTGNLCINDEWALNNTYYYMERFHKMKWLVQSFFFFLTFLQEFVIRTLKALTYGHSFIFDSFSFCNPLRKIISRYSLMVAWWNRSNTATHITSKWFNHWFPEDDDLHTLGQYCPYLW